MENKNATQLIGYQGIVKIQSVKGDKVYKEVIKHNAGTSSLFRYVANCLIGNYNQSMMPRYIRLFNCENPKQKSEEYGNLPDLWSTPVSALNLPFNTVQVRSDPSSNKTIEKPYISEFTFMIPYTQIQSSFNVICLYNVTTSGRNVTPLAYIILDEDYNIEQGNTSNIVIT